jgi:NADH-quinone oxidoreductase subunit F
MLKRSEFLTKHYGAPDSWTLAHYEKNGGYRGVRRALGMSREALVEELKKAHIRGRGGAGFDAGTKMSFMPKEVKKPHYLVVNADEGEPGTFKDRSIMEMNPHALIEGCIIGCTAIGAQTAYIYVRDELHLAKARLWAAIEEAKAKGYLGQRPLGLGANPINVFVHTGAGAYICGEETALLNSLEGRRGEPRIKPPFPAQAGAFGMPTTVNNVETIAILPSAIEFGCDEFSKLSELHNFNDGGARIFGVSGHVKRPGLYECSVGLTLRELIYDLGGGTIDDRPILGVIPGGASCPVHRPDEVVNSSDPRFAPYNGKPILDLPLGVDTFRMVGSMLGTCCATVLSDAVDPVLALQNLMHFYKHESCGQCTPCREGCGWMVRILDKVVEGTATMAELDRLSDVASDITGNTICAFGDGAATPALTFVRRFRKNFEDYVSTGGKSQTGRLAL